MSDTIDPMDALNRLAERVTQVLAELGLTVEHFLIDPRTKAIDADGRERAVKPNLQCVFSIESSALTRDVEQKQFDDAFETMLREQKAAEHDSALEEVRAEAVARSERKKAEMKARLEAGGGILPHRDEGERSGA